MNNIYVYTFSSNSQRHLLFTFEIDFFIGILLGILKFHPSSQLLITSIKYHLYSDPESQLSSQISPLNHSHTYSTITLTSPLGYVMGISDVTDPNLDLPISFTPTAPSLDSLISLIVSPFYQLLRTKESPLTVCLLLNHTPNPPRNTFYSMAGPTWFWCLPSYLIYTLAIFLLIHSHWPFFLSLLKQSQ